MTQNQATHAKRARLQAIRDTIAAEMRREAREQGVYCVRLVRQGDTRGGVVVNFWLDEEGGEGLDLGRHSGGKLRQRTITGWARAFWPEVERVSTIVREELADNTVRLRLPEEGER